mmetsp:Transcript_1752/g.5899  ORF Transcript_1752/g.5899 Transcript_1752/m.5899 type:complete len:244 (+) Transcript_1752:668-1399(+)
MPRGATNTLRDVPRSRSLELERSRPRRSPCPPGGLLAQRHPPRRRCGQGTRRRRGKKPRRWRPPPRRQLRRQTGGTATTTKQPAGGGRPLQAPALAAPPLAPARRRTQRPLRLRRGQRRRRAPRLRADDGPDEGPDHTRADDDPDPRTDITGGREHRLTDFGRTVAAADYGGAGAASDDDSAESTSQQEERLVGGRGAGDRPGLPGRRRGDAVRRLRLLEKSDAGPDAQSGPGHPRRLRPPRR